MEAIWQSIQTKLDNKREDMLHLFESIVNIDSGLTDTEGIRRVVDLLAQQMSAHGIRPEIIEMAGGGDVLIGHWNESAPGDPIVFIGHTDTVFPKGTVQRHPFHISEGGIVTGPGNYDMKGGLVIALYAVIILSELGYQDRPVKLVFVGDEELLHRDTDADQVLRAACRGAAAALNFECGYDNGDIIVARKGAAIASFQVKGVGAHSGAEAGKGRSAILEAAYKIQALEAMNDYERVLIVNVGRIEGGTAVNVVPDDCQVNFGFRYDTNDQREALIKKLDALFKEPVVEGCQLSYQIETMIEAMEELPGSRTLFSHLAQQAQTYLGQTLTPVKSAGASDSAIAASVGVPTLCGLGVTGGAAHTEQEYSHLASLFERTALTTLCVWNYDRAPLD